MTEERWCPSGQHWRKRADFRSMPKGKTARDCTDCELKARERSHINRLMDEAAQLTGKAHLRISPDGVDIDAIHFKRGLVAPHLRRAR